MYQLRLNSVGRDPVKISKDKSPSVSMVKIAKTRLHLIHEKEEDQGIKSRNEIFITNVNIVKEKDK